MLKYLYLEQTKNMSEKQSSAHRYDWREPQPMYFQPPLDIDNRQVRSDEQALAGVDTATAGVGEYQREVVTAEEATRHQAILNDLQVDPDIVTSSASTTEETASTRQEP